MIYALLVVYEFWCNIIN